MGLLPRQGDATDITWCDVEPCFVFHVANAFDGEDGQVILDVIAYPTMFASGGSGLSPGGSGLPSGSGSSTGSSTASTQSAPAPSGPALTMINPLGDLLGV